MDEKYFMVFNEDHGVMCFKETLEEAKREAQQMADKYGNETFILTSVTVVTPNEVNVKIDSYESAIKYLGRDRIVDMNGIPFKHGKAMIAMYKLITIAEAWNKADNFVPDFEHKAQFNYFPYFEYDEKSGRFICLSTYNSFKSAYFGSRLCFKTCKRAEQFGTQFIDLWNDFLLF